MVDIIAVADAIHQIDVIAEESDDVGNREVMDAFEVKIGADNVHDALAEFLFRIDLDDVDDVVIIDRRDAGNRRGAVSVFEILHVAKFLDVFFGQAIVLRENDFAVFVRQGLGENAAGEAVVNAEFLGELETSGAAEVITLAVEVIAAEELDAAFVVGRLARLEFRENAHQGRGARGDFGIFREGRVDEFGIAKKIAELFLVLKAASHEKDVSRELELAVQTDIKGVAGVGFGLEPGAAARNEVALVEVLARLAVHFIREIGARGTNDLGDDDALGAVDDERSGIGHQGDVAHENLGFFDFAGLGGTKTEGSLQLA